MMAISKRVFLVMGILMIFSFLPPGLGFAAKQGGVLKIGMPSPPDGFDPANNRTMLAKKVGCHIFEPLVMFIYDEKKRETRSEPCLAEKWETSKDGLVWTFYIRKGVKFHDGTSLNGEAVKFSLDRVRAEKPATMFGTDLRYAIDRIDVPSEYTVRIHLKKVMPIFLDFLGQPAGGIMSPESIKKYGPKVGLHPMGTGPFKFVKYVAGEQVELVVNKDYRKGRAHLDGIIFRILPDDSARINMLLTGEIDIAHNAPVPDLERLRKEGNLDVISWPSAGILRLWMNFASAPTSDLKVRQAIKYAIDKKAILDSILLKNSSVADSIVSTYSWGHFPADPPVYDPEKAKKLLTEAGWVEKDADGLREKDGKKLVFKMIASSTSHYPMYRETALAMQEYLRKVGFDCQIQFVEAASFYPLIRRTIDKNVGGNAYYGWSSDTNAWFVLNQLHSATWYPDKKSDTYYRNPEYDKVLDKAAVELDPEKRFELYKKAQMILANDSPVIVLWVANKMLAKRKYVQNVTTVPIPVGDVLNFREAWLDK